MKAAVLSAAELARDSLAADFSQLEKSLSGSRSLGLRREAFDSFQREGFPTARTEAWKNTSVLPLLKTKFENSALRSAHASYPLPELSGLDRVSPHRLVFVDGKLLEASVSIPGVGIGKFAEENSPKIEATPENAFFSLNAAFAQDGAVIRIARGASVKDPIQLVFISTSPSAGPVSSYVRNVINVEEGATASVIETHLGNGFTNSWTRLTLARGAALEHTKVNGEGREAFHVGRVNAELAQDSHLKTNAISFGGAWVRSEVKVRMSEKGASCAMNGLYVATDQQHVDHHTIIEHAAPHCGSQEYYKGVLGGSARAVFSGRILVEKDAQKTAAEQSNQNLLLTDLATVHTKPQLQIYADDVKCAHGATVGKLDPDSIFYLRSRGIDESEARKILIEAFASDVLDQLGSLELKKRLGAILSEWMQKSQDKS